MKRSAWLLFLVLPVAAALHAQNIGYVVDNSDRDGRIWFVDLSAQLVVGSQPTGSQASEFLALPNNAWGFVSNEGASTVTMLDLVTNKKMVDIPMSQGVGGAGSLTNTPDGRYVYVANDVSNHVSVIDVYARAVVATVAVGATPVQVNMSPDGKYAYSVNQDDGTVSVINVNRNTVDKTLAVGTRPNQMAILPNLTTSYVLNTGSNDVSLIDLATNQVTGTVPAGLGPVSVAYSSDSRYLYVVNNTGNSVSVLDTRTNTVVADIMVGSQPIAMVTTFDNKFGYVCNYGSNTVTLVDLTLNSAEVDISVGAQPTSMMLDPDENFLYVTNLNAGSQGSLSVIDVNKDKVAATVLVGLEPVQIAGLSAPTLLETAPNPAKPGDRITLNGEGFIGNSKARFSSSAPPQTTLITPAVLDSQGLAVTVPPYTGNSITVDVLNPDGNSSERILLPSGTSAPDISKGGVVEGAGFQKAPFPIAANGIVSVFGKFPGMTRQDAPAFVFPLPTTLGGAAVTFNGLPAHLLAAIPGADYDQINVVAPVRIDPLADVRVAVTANGQTSAVEDVHVAPTSPGIFQNFTDGSCICTHVDGSLVSPSHPAARGETLVMYVAGLGNTSPPPLDGDKTPADVYSWALYPVAVSVGGTLAADASFYGLTPGFAGLYQVNFTVPSAAPLADAVPMIITSNGRISNTVEIAVK